MRRITPGGLQRNSDGLLSEFQFSSGSDGIIFTCPTTIRQGRTLGGEMRQLMLLLVLLAPVALVVGGGWVVSEARRRFWVGLAALTIEKAR